MSSSRLHRISLITGIGLVVAVVIGFVGWGLSLTPPAPPPVPEAGAAIPIAPTSLPAAPPPADSPTPATVTAAPGAAMTSAAGLPVRDITPAGVTPPPPVTGPLVRQPPPPPPSRPPERQIERRLPLVLVEAAGQIRAGALSIRLAGIAPLKPDATCTDTSGRVWPCGTAATAALRALIRTRALTCTLGERQTSGEATTLCRLGRLDVAEWLAGQGWAEAAPGSPYARAAAEAREAGRGQFRPRADAPLPAFVEPSLPDLSPEASTDLPPPVAAARTQ